MCLGKTLNHCTARQACQWCHLQGYAQQQKLIQEALGHLFQAAAVFGAASQAAQYGEQADLTASCILVKHVIQDMLLALTGKSQCSDSQVCIHDPTSMSESPE